MANDRLYLVCVKCRQGYPIYKFYPGEGQGFGDDEVGTAFIEHHLDEQGLMWAADLGETSPFVVCTERKGHEFTHWQPQERHHKVSFCPNMPDGYAFGTSDD